MKRNCRRTNVRPCSHRPASALRGAMAGLFLFLSSLQACAQLRDYAFTRDSSAWLSSPNAAGLTHFRGDHLSTAEVYGQLRRGGFTDFSGSPKATDAGARVESIYRLSPRTVVGGSMSYDNATGREMGGSVFLNRQHRPFDIVEDSLTNLGRKHSDTYRLTGAVGTDLWKGISLGAQMDYTAANYAKYKDLRHRNKLMDMDIDAGLLLPIGRTASVGADVFYRRTTESIIYSLYGRKEKVYKSLIDYAAFMGKVEQYGNYGYTSSYDEMPFVDQQTGFGVQLELTPTQRLTLHNDFRYARRQGYYGTKAANSVTYTDHESHLYAYHGRLTWQRGRSRHLLDLSIEAENLENQLRTTRELKNDGGFSYYEYYAPVKSANKLWSDGALAYTGYMGLREGLPAWTVKAAVTWNHRRQTGYQYPYFRRQELDSQEWFASLGRHFHLKSGLLLAQLSGSFRKGSGSPAEDGTFAPPSDKQTAPPSMDTWLYRDYLYLTAPQYSVGGMLRYTFFFPGTRLQTHTSLSCNHRKANAQHELRTWLRGRDQTTLRLAVGCTF